MSATSADSSIHPRELSRATTSSITAGGSNEANAVTSSARRIDPRLKDASTCQLRRSTSVPPESRVEGCVEPGICLLQPPPDRTGRRALVAHASGTPFLLTALCLG